MNNEASLAAFREVVMSRRSVRKFEQTPVPEAVMSDCLGLALLAPNSSNLQPWEFYWVRSPEKKKALVSACLDQKASATAAELIVIVARTRTWRRNTRAILDQWPQSEVPEIVRRYYGRLTYFMYTQGPFSALGWLRWAFLSVVGVFRAVPREPCSLNEMKIWAVKSTALAAQTLMLALRAHGFDSCPMEGFDRARVRRILQLPADAVVVMVIGAGKGAPEGIYHERIRFPVDTAVFEA